MSIKFGKINELKIKFKKKNQWHDPIILLY